MAGLSSLPFLFMTLDDVVEPHGLVYPIANTVIEDPSLRPPPGLDYSGGAVVFGAFHQDGLVEVYAANTTGWEPIKSGGELLAGAEASICVNL